MTGLCWFPRAFLQAFRFGPCYDPATHNGSVPGVVVAVMSWLATRKEAVPPVTPKKVLELLPDFQSRRRELDSVWGGYPSWSEVFMTAI